MFSSVIRKNPQKCLCVWTDDITASDRPNESTRTIQVRPGVSTSSELFFPCGASHVYWLNYMNHRLRKYPCGRFFQNVCRSNFYLEFEENSFEKSATRTFSRLIAFFILNWDSFCRFFLFHFLLFLLLFDRIGFPMMLVTTAIAMVYLLICHSAFSWNSP